MSETHRHRGDLALLIDVAGQLCADSGRDEADLQRRDRTIGLTMTHVHDPAKRLRMWLGCVDRADESTGWRAQAATTVTRTILTVLGLAIGASTALTMFYYDGTHPVNVLKVLAVFVLLQLALLTMTTILILPMGLRRFVPGLATLQEALSLLSPGRLIVALVRILPASWREAFDQARGGSITHHRLFAGVYKWLMLLGSQQFAFGFNAGALVAAVCLITATDLAFGWSTTLQLRSEDIYQWTQILSLPWWWLDRARPSVELIEVTRFYRTPSGSVYDLGMDGHPGMPGGWWPFLVMSIVAYGLLPRMVLVFIAQRRLNSAIRGVMAVLPGAAELHDRLEGRWVATAATTQEESAKLQTWSEADGGARIHADAGMLVINWANVPVAAHGLGLGFSGEVIHAGGTDIDADRQAIARACATTTPVVIVVRAWEPPLLELIDFVAELRGVMGPGRMIHVAPVGVNAEGNPASPAARDLAIWRARLATVGDPWLKVSNFA